MSTLQEQYLSLINQYIQNTKSSDDQLIKSLSRKLTLLSKKEGFLEIAAQMIISSTMPKQSLVLTTSLMKDRFKFQIQILGIDKLELYYRGLVSMAGQINVTYKNIKSLSYAVYSNISLSLAYIFIATTGINVNNKSIDIQNYLHCFLNQPKLFNYYIKTLEFIASQVDNSKFVIDQRTRSNARVQILDQQLNVLEFLNINSQQFFSMHPSSGGNIIQAFQAWIGLNYKVQIMNNLPDHTVFKQLQQYIKSGIYTEQTSDCLKTITYQLRNVQENIKLFQSMSGCCMQLLNNINRCLEEGDSLTAEEYLRVVAEFFRKNIETLFSNYDQNIQNIMNILTGYIGNMTIDSFQDLMDFFQCFIDYLLELKQNGHNFNSVMPIVVLLYDNMCKRTRFGVALSRKIQSNPSRLSHMGRDAQQILQTRQTMLDIYEKISNLLGQKQYLQLVLTKINQCTQNIQKQQQMWLWLQVFIYSLVDSLKEYPELDQNITTLVQIYIQSDQGNSPLIFKRTALKMVRNIFTIKDKKDKGLQLVTTLMSKTVDGLKHTFLFAVSQKAFLKGCQCNAKILESCFIQFLNILHMYPGSTTIVQGIANILIKNQKLFQQYFGQILSFLLGKFNPNQLLTDKKTHFHSLIKVIEVVKQQKATQIQKIILKNWLRQKWNILMQFFTSPTEMNGKIQDIDRLIEMVARLLKYIIRILQFQFLQFLQNMFNNAQKIFQKYPICTYLYLIEVSVSVLHKNNEYKNYHYNLFNKFTSLTSYHLETAKDLTDYDNLLDDYISLSNKLLLIDPTFMFTGSLLPSIIDIAVTALSNGQANYKAAKSSCFFLQTLFRIYWPQVYIDQYNKTTQKAKCIIDPQYTEQYLFLKSKLFQYLLKIMDGLFCFLSTCPNQSAVQYIMDCIEAQVRAFPNQNPQIWTQVLSKFPSEILVISQKQKMIILMQNIKLDPLSIPLQKQIYHIITLINRRMINSHNRRNCLK